MKKSLIALITMLTMSNSWALAALQPGVYQQMYADGRLKSIVTVLYNPGVSDYMAQYGLGDNTYVCMDALDNKGTTVEEFAVRYDENAPAFYGFTINANNLQKVEQAEWFTVEANKKSKLKLDSSQADRLTVSGAGSLYDGEYYFSPRSAVQANRALMVYAYESTRKQYIADEGLKENASYGIFQMPKMPWLATLAVRVDKRDDKEVILDNGFNIVMDCDKIDIASYKPFFKSNKYEEWSQSGLEDLKTEVNGDFSSLYMHRYIVKNYPALAENNNIKLQSKDFYGGEGPNAIFTRLYYVKRFVDGEDMVSGLASHSDDGTMRVEQYIGTKAITGDEVRVREHPNTNCNILGYVNRGDVVQVLGVKYGSPWAAVKLSNGLRGYVSTQFIDGIHAIY